MATILRESFTGERFVRIPEPDLVMDSDEAVAAFVRASRPNGVLSGVYTFLVEQACKMVRPGDRVLDLGCGPAALLASIAALCPDSEFVGVDLSEGMITSGEDTLGELGASNVELRLDDMTRLASVPSGSIDVVLSSMALHHLPDTDHLRRMFEAIDRVLVPGGRVLLVDFGRIKSLKSVEYLVARAIPKSEPILEHDYRASLRAAFSGDELRNALPAELGQRVRLYSTLFSPVMQVVMTPFPSPSATSPRVGGARDPSAGRLPLPRRLDLWQLRLFLRLGGMPAP